MKLKKLNFTHLFLVMAIILAILSIFSPTAIQIQITFAATLFYVLTSFLHHYLDKSLTLETTLEYILLASLVLVVVTSIAL